jgi:hypothetical protein
MKHHERKRWKGLSDFLRATTAEGAGARKDASERGDSMTELPRFLLGGIKGDCAWNGEEPAQGAEGREEPLLARDRNRTDWAQRKDRG